MNGTETHFGEIGKLLGTSDTDALFRVYHSLNIDNESLKTLDSRFMGFKNGKMFFTNPNAYYSSLEKLKTSGKNSAIVVASCFPSELDSEKIESGYYWEEGQKIKTSKVKYTQYEGVNYYNYDYDDYNRSYIKTKQTTLWECIRCGSVHALNGHFNGKNFIIGKCKECAGELEKITVEGQEAECYVNAIID